MSAKCKVKNANTYEGRCRFDWSLFKRIIITPVGAEYTGSDFDSWLMENIHNADADNRFYPMPMFSGSEDNSEDNVTSQNGYGKSYFIRQGNMGLTQNYIQNYCMTNKLAEFNDGVERAALIIDSNGHVWGTEGENGGMRGFNCTMFCSAARPNSSDTIQEPSISYTFVVPEQFSAKMVESIELSVTDFHGLEDIEMVVAKSGSNVNMSFVSKCDGNDVTSEMSALTAAAFFKVSSAGVKTALSNVTYDSTNKKFVVATTELTGATKLALGDPSVLYGQQVLYKDCENTPAIPE